jgi:uncharacterized protein
LPRGAVGVARQPERAQRRPDETLIEAQRLLDAGLPFDAHEVLEDAWKESPPSDRALWKGLAQLAVGLTHAARGNQVGAATLLRRGAAAIQPYRDARPYGVDVSGLVEWADAAAEHPDSASVPALRT